MPSCRELQNCILFKLYYSIYNCSKWCLPSSREFIFLKKFHWYQNTCNQKIKYLFITAVAWESVVQQFFTCHQRNMLFPHFQMECYILLTKSTLLSSFLYDWQSTFFVIQKELIIEGSFSNPAYSYYHHLERLVQYHVPS